MSRDEKLNSLIERTISVLKSVDQSWKTACGIVEQSKKRLVDAVGLVRHQLCISNADLALHGWPIDLVVETSSLDGKIVKRCTECNATITSQRRSPSNKLICSKCGKRIIDSVFFDDLLSSIALLELFESADKDTNPLIVDGAINHESLGERLLLVETVNSWKDLMIELFPMADPKTIEFMILLDK